MSFEDAHSYFYNFGGKRGQGKTAHFRLFTQRTGWFAIFDGHAGKSAADYCGKQLHEVTIDVKPA